MSKLKEKVAKAACAYIDDNMIVGVGTGSTINCFIEELVHIKHKIDACVASSKVTETRLRELGLPVINLNVANEVSIYIDGADEVNSYGEMIKGGGGALTGEKIIASVAKQFVCIVEERKLVKKLGEFPIAIEVIPMARSYVAREIVKLGGNPQYREDFTTDNGNQILDVYNLNIDVPSILEDKLNVIPGVVENGIFAKRGADIVLVSKEHEVTHFKVKSGTW